MLAQIYRTINIKNICSPVNFGPITEMAIWHGRLVIHEIKWRQIDLNLNYTYIESNDIYFNCQWLCGADFEFCCCSFLLSNN